MRDIVSSVLELFRILGPTQTIILLIAIAAAVWFWIGVSRAISPNPRRHTDEYVKSHMWEFYSWFASHPEDKAYYEGLLSGDE